MKLDTLDAYHLRARVSAEIIVLSPVILTVFLCLGEIFNVASSSVMILILIAFSNYLPILQRRKQSRLKFENYAAEMLYPEDCTLEEQTKLRYYGILASENEGFAMLLKPDDTPEFKECCESAVAYLREYSRENKLVKEENINFGFYRNLVAGRTTGIMLSISGAIFSAVVLSFRLLAQSNGSYRNCIMAVCLNVLILLFWLLMVNEETLEGTGRRYALTLLRTIDMLK